MTVCSSERHNPLVSGKWWKPWQKPMKSKRNWINSMTEGKWKSGWFHYILLPNNGFIKCFSPNEKHWYLLINFHVHSFIIVSDGMIKGLTFTSVCYSRFHALKTQNPSIFQSIVSFIPWLQGEDNLKENERSEKGRSI